MSNPENAHLIGLVVIKCLIFQVEFQLLNLSNGDQVNSINECNLWVFI